MQRRAVHAFVEREDPFYVARAVNLPVVTQGSTLDEALANLREAVDLHLEGEDPADTGFDANPPIVVTLELEGRRVA